MNEQSPEIKALLQTDEEFNQLAAQHHQLEDRLQELTSKHYLSEPEQVEEITLKKRKLALKDRMEDDPAPASRSSSTISRFGSPRRTKTSERVDPRSSRFDSTSRLPD